MLVSVISSLNLSLWHWILENNSRPLQTYPSRRPGHLALPDAVWLLEITEVSGMVSGHRHGEYLKVPISENTEMVLSWLIWNTNSEKTLWKKWVLSFRMQCVYIKAKISTLLDVLCRIRWPGVETVFTTWNYADWKLWLSKGIDSTCISILWLP